MTTSINLVPYSFRRRLLIRRRLRQWTVAWVLAACGAGSVSLEDYGLVLTRQHRLSQLEQKCEPLRLQERASVKMQEELDRLYDRESLLAKLERSDQPAQLIGIIGQAATGERREVHIGNFELVPISQMVTEQKVDSNGQTRSISREIVRMQLQLDGLGLDDLAVAGFVAQLREAGVFQSVNLRSSVDARGLSPDVRQFQVVCVYEE